MKIIKYIFCIIIALTLSSCTDIMDLKPKDMLDADALFGSPEGIQVYMANLYYQCPIEDFAYFPKDGYNYNASGPNNGGQNAAMRCDEAIHSESTAFMGSGEFAYWGYDFVRSVNLFLEIIPTLTLKDEQKAQLTAEGNFLRAYGYFEMVKRYGGVPIITSTQNWNGDVEALKVPRNTEKETWDFVMSECDKAIAGLPAVNGSGARRANKYAACALKSRAALHAASVSKFWNKAPLAGPAVDAGLVGMSASDANGYYSQCIEASAAIINSGIYGLYVPTPATPADAAKNIQAYFEDPDISLKESIFIKGFTAPIDRQANNYEIWFNPNQTANGWPHPGRNNPTLDMVDVYETYSNPGQNAPVVTSADADDVTNYNGFNASKNYYKFDDPTQIFADKDARLRASIILPGSTWKKTKIVIQAGLVKPDGTSLIETGGSYAHTDGKTYYTYGAATVTEYSGFSTYGGNMTRTGFSFRKFLNEAVNVIPGWNKGTIDWVDFRYAEILLNYEEAVLESGYTADDAINKATTYLNSTRRRAGHTVDIPLTIANVLRERRAELAFENKRVWDLLRRREFHELFTSARRHTLKPLIDLRSNPPKYIFVRGLRTGESALNFQQYYYYRSIPGTAGNGLIQNPQY